MRDSSYSLAPEHSGTEHEGDGGGQVGGEQLLGRRSGGDLGQGETCSRVARLPSATSRNLLAAARYLH